MGKNRGVELARRAADINPNLSTKEHKKIQDIAWKKRSYSERGLKSMLTQKKIPHNNGSSDGKCFITTAVCKSMNLPDDCYELTEFRKFRDTFMNESEEMQNEVKEYYEIAPKICLAIDRTADNPKEVYSYILSAYLKPALHAIETGSNQEAHDIYRNMVFDLKSSYIDEESEYVDD